MVIDHSNGQAIDMSENFTNRPQDAEPQGSKTADAQPHTDGPQPPPGHDAAPWNASPQDTGREQRRLERTKDGRMIAGVCSGAGAYLGIDPNIIRIGLAILTFFGGTGVAAYVIGWLLLPEEGHQISIAQDLFNKTKK